MSNYDYFKQYQAEHQRIRDKINAEENPIHREHLVFIEQMIDDKIRAALPQMQQDPTKVNVEAYFNGEPATDENIVKGVRNMIVNALKHIGRRR